MVFQYSRIDTSRKICKTRFTGRMSRQVGLVVERGKLIKYSYIYNIHNKYSYCVLCKVYMRIL